jgi:hypothetical protein
MRVAEFADCRTVDLDEIHWEESGESEKRDEALTIQMTASTALEPLWVIEGVYGWLADVVTPRATALIWLNLPWNECKAGLERRGQRRDATDIQFNELLQWAERYWIRQTSTSFAGHSKIFEQFSGERIVLNSRAEVDQFTRCLVRDVR